MAIMAAELTVDEKRQERHQELVSSQSDIRGAIQRLQAMTAKVRYGDSPPPETANVSKDIDLSSLALVLSNLPKTMDGLAERHQWHPGSVGRRIVLKGLRGRTRFSVIRRSNWRRT